MKNFQAIRDFKIIFSKTKQKYSYSCHCHSVILKLYVQKCPKILNFL